MTKINRLLELRKLITSAARICDVPEGCITGPQKCREIVLARQMAAYAAYHELGISSVQIGRAMQRDHTTILHSLKAIKKEIARSNVVAAQVEELMLIARRERPLSPLKKLPSMLIPVPPNFSVEAQLNEAVGDGFVGVRAATATLAKRLYRTHRRLYDPNNVRMSA